MLHKINKLDLETLSKAFTRKFRPRSVDVEENKWKRYFAVSDSLEGRSDGLLNDTGKKQIINHYGSWLNGRFRDVKDIECIPGYTYALTITNRKGIEKSLIEILGGLKDEAIAENRLKGAQINIPNTNCYFASIADGRKETRDDMMRVAELPVAYQWNAKYLIGGRKQPIIIGLNPSRKRKHRGTDSLSIKFVKNYTERDFNVDYLENTNKNEGN